MQPSKACSCTNTDVSTYAGLLPASPPERNEDMSDLRLFRSSGLLLEGNVRV